MINLAELDNVGVSQKDVEGYLGKVLGWTGHYGWEITKFGVGIGASYAALNGGYEYLRALPVLENVDWMAHQVRYLPQLVGIAAPLFVGVQAKRELVDNGLAALKNWANKDA